MIPGWRDENRAVEYHHQEGADGGGVCDCHDRGFSLSEFSFKKQRGVSFRPTYFMIPPSFAAWHTTYPAGLPSCCLGWWSNRERAGLGWARMYFVGVVSGLGVSASTCMEVEVGSVEMLMEWKRREPSPGPGPSVIVPL